uniref:J domain-containing protein n=1 Tax=Meloidogyne incognita TaxID=6306 RepID=A0A914L145_MELIC
MNLNEALILMGLTAPLDKQTLNKMYRKLALKYHPDKNPDGINATEMMQKINTAKNIIEMAFFPDENYGDEADFEMYDIGYEYEYNEEHEKEDEEEDKEEIFFEENGEWYKWEEE